MNENVLWVLTVLGLVQLILVSILEEREEKRDLSKDEHFDSKIDNILLVLLLLTLCVTGFILFLDLATWFW